MFCFNFSALSLRQRDTLRFTGIIYTYHRLSDNNTVDRPVTDNTGIKKLAVMSLFFTSSMLAPRLSSR